MSKLKKNKIRVYTDHTGRFYEDYTREEYDAISIPLRWSNLGQLFKR